VHCHTGSGNNCSVFCCPLSSAVDFDSARLPGYNTLHAASKAKLYSMLLPCYIMNLKKEEVNVALNCMCVCMCVCMQPTIKKSWYRAELI